MASDSAKVSLIIGCGALGQEMVDFVRSVGAQGQVKLQCLPADLHNRPALIPRKLRELLAETQGQYQRTFVLYGDCGTAGGIDAVCDEFGVTRIPGAHCYQFYMGEQAFDRYHDDTPTTFYLTDYLVRHFETLVIQGLALDRHPELMPDYFGHYTDLLYLAQIDDAELDAAGRAAAERLGLRYTRRLTGLGDMQPYLQPIAITRAT